MSGILNTASLFSGQGIDVASVVNQLVSAARAPEQAWLNQQQTIQVQEGSLNQLNTELSALQTAVDALKDPAGALKAVTTSSSDPNIVTISASAGSAIGSHAVVVNNLAATSSYYTAAVASSSTTLADGSFTLQVGSGTPTNITIDSSDNTLTGLAAAINGMNLGVAANVITDASGARLSLVAQNSGAAGDLAITSDSSGLGFTKAVTGVNASLTVDGVPVSSATNSVSGVIPGLTFNLAGSDPATTVSVGISADANSATQAIDNFVNAYNSLIADLNAQFTYNTTTQSSGPLSGDGTARMVEEQVLGFASYSAGGAGSIQTLRSLGINMNDDGTLSVDSATLNNAVTGNYQDVQNFFQSGSGFATYLDGQLSQLTDPTQGAFYLDLKGAQSTYQTLQDQINDFETYIATQQDQWTTQYNQINVLLQEFPLLQETTDAELGMPLQNSSTGHV
jgi:flagellar hook-associated protein 2